jgi:hypothetical protein
MVFIYELCGKFYQNSDIVSGRTNFNQCKAFGSKHLCLSNRKLLMVVESLAAYFALIFHFIFDHCNLH